MTTIDRLPPHNIDAEEAVLGSCIIDPDAILEIATFLEPAHFFRTRNGWIYEAIQSLHDTHRPIDLLTLSDELRRRERLQEDGDEAHLISLINAVPTSSNVAAYAQMVADLAQRRRMIQAAGQVAQLNYDESMQTAEAMAQSQQVVLEASANLANEGIQSASQIFTNLVDTTQHRREKGGGMTGISSGLKDLDKMIRGFNPSRFYVIAGRPGQGKSALAINMILHMARLGKKVAFFNLEMSTEEISQRMVASQAGLSHGQVSEGNLDDMQMGRFMEAAGQLSELKLFVDDTPGLNMATLRAKARRLHIQHGLDILFVDYLQIMQGANATWDELTKISYLSRELKVLAKSLNIPVVVLSQLSRAVEQRRDKRPLLSDLRSSGTIEQDADCVIFLYRDEVYNGEFTEMPNVAELSVAKNRSGQTGVAKVYCDLSKMRFRNLVVETVGL